MQDSVDELSVLISTIVLHGKWEVLLKGVCFVVVCAGTLFVASKLSTTKIIFLFSLSVLEHGE